MPYGCAVLILGLISGGSAMMVAESSQENAGQARQAGPTGPLGDLLRRDDWKSARLRVGVVEGGKLTYREARLTGKDDLERLKSVLRKARYEAAPGSYEVDPEQALELELGSGRAPTVTLYAPPRHLSVGEPGQASYYEVSSKDLIDLCPQKAP